MTDRLTDRDLDEMEARCKAATPGPWTAAGSVVRTGKDGDAWDIGVNLPKVYGCANSAAFIAAARTDLPRVVAELRELRRLARETEAKFGFIRRGPDKEWKAFDAFMEHLAALKAAAGGGE